MAEIAFGRSGRDLAEASLSSSEVLRKMMIRDPVAAYRADLETRSNPDFWLRCIQIAFLEKLAAGTVRESARPVPQDAAPV